MVKLEKFNEDPALLDEVCSIFDLQPRGSAGEHSAAVGAKFDVSNKQRLGFTEVELVQKMIDGVTKLIGFEEELAGGASAADIEAKFIMVLKGAKGQGFSMRQCFDELDVDRDGKISAEELERAGLAGVGREGGFVAEIDEEFGAMIDMNHPLAGQALTFEVGFCLRSGVRLDRLQTRRGSGQYVYTPTG